MLLFFNQALIKVYKVITCKIKKGEIIGYKKALSVSLYLWPLVFWPSTYISYANILLHAIRIYCCTKFYFQVFFGINFTDFVERFCAYPSKVLQCSRLLNIVLYTCLKFIITLWKFIMRKQKWYWGWQFYRRNTIIMLRSKVVRQEEMIYNTTNTLLKDDIYTWH